MSPIDAVPLIPEPSSTLIAASFVCVTWFESACATSSPTKPVPLGTATSLATLIEPFANQMLMLLNQLQQCCYL